MDGPDRKREKLPFLTFTRTNRTHDLLLATSLRLGHAISPPPATLFLSSSSPQAGGSFLTFTAAGRSPHPFLLFSDLLNSATTAAPAVSLSGQQCGSRVLLTAERSPPARYSFFIPTSADIFLWTAFRKQRIPAEESDCALFSSELLLNFITDVGSSGDGRSANRRFHLSAYSNSSTSTPIPADHSSKLVVIRGCRCVLFTSDGVPDLVPLCDGEG